MPESSERGALTEAVYYILLALHEPMHGYGIMQYVSDISAGRVALGPGTLYGAIGTLMEKKWIAAVPDSSGSRKKEYIVTALGKETVRNEMERLQELLQNGQMVLGGDQK